MAHKCHIASTISISTPLSLFARLLLWIRASSRKSSSDQKRESRHPRGIRKHLGVLLLLLWQLCHHFEVSNGPGNAKELWQLLQRVGRFQGYPGEAQGWEWMNTCQSCELIVECQHHWVRQRVANPSLKLRDCCAEERRIFSLCEQHDEWTKFSMFSTQDQDRPLCKLDTFFFFELWGFENLFACLGRKVDRRRRIRGLPKKASRITSTLDVEPSFLDVDAAILSPLLEVGKSGTSHGDGENPWVFARGILWCAAFLRWSLLQNDELFDGHLTDFNLWQLKHIETEVDTSVAGAYKRLHKLSQKRRRQINIRTLTSQEITEGQGPHLSPRECHYWPETTARRDCLDSCWPVVDLKCTWILKIHFWLGVDTFFEPQLLISNGLFWDWIIEDSPQKIFLLQQGQESIPQFLSLYDCTQATPRPTARSGGSHTQWLTRENVAWKLWKPRVFVRIFTLWNSLFSHFP